MRAVALRLTPGQDLKVELGKFAASTHLEAGCVLCAVGSLKQACLRYADQPDGAILDRKLEIVSLTGTVSQNGMHLHIAVSTGSGQTVGGHVLDGCLVYTTVELVLGVLDDVRFQRELDPATGFKELKIVPRPGATP